MIPVIYNADYFPSFADFGLSIPMANDRFFQIADHLPKKAKVFKPSIPEKGEFFPTREDLLRIHTTRFVDTLFSKDLPGEMNRCFEYTDPMGGLRYGTNYPTLEQSENFRDHIFKKAFQVKYSMEVALKHGLSICLGGGMHHARKDYGHGFCLINDVVVSVLSLINEKKLKRVWIVDVDAHLGDGTIDCTYRDDRFWTIDLHMKDGWPNDDESLKQKIQADIHVPIAKGEEATYMAQLQTALEESFKLGNEPDMIICLMGADPFEEDELPSSQDMQLTQEQMLKRDQLIYQYAALKKVPINVLLAGGYGKNSWKVTTQFLDWLNTQIK